MNQAKWRNVAKAAIGLLCSLHKDVQHALFCSRQQPLPKSSASTPTPAPDGMGEDELPAAPLARHQEAALRASAMGQDDQDDHQQARDQQVPVPLHTAVQDGGDEHYCLSPASPAQTSTTVALSTNRATPCRTLSPVAAPATQCDQQVVAGASGTAPGMWPISYSMGAPSIVKAALLRALAQELRVAGGYSQGVDAAMLPDQWQVVVWRRRQGASARDVSTPCLTTTDTTPTPLSGPMPRSGFLIKRTIRTSASAPLPCWTTTATTRAPPAGPLLRPSLVAMRTSATPPLPHLRTSTCIPSLVSSPASSPPASLSALLVRASAQSTTPLSRRRSHASQHTPPPPKPLPPLAPSTITSALPHTAAPQDLTEVILFKQVPAPSLSIIIADAPSPTPSDFLNLGSLGLSALPSPTAISRFVAKPLELSHASGKVDCILSSLPPLSLSPNSTPSSFASATATTTITTITTTPITTITASRTTPTATSVTTVCPASPPGATDGLDTSCLLVDLFELEPTDFLGQGAFGAVYGVSFDLRPLGWGVLHLALKCCRPKEECFKDLPVIERDALLQCVGCPYVIQLVRHQSRVAADGVEEHRFLMERAAGSLLDVMRLLWLNGTGHYRLHVIVMIDLSKAKQHFIENEDLTLVHSDIKPDNILLVENKLKFGDMGGAVRAGRWVEIHTALYAPPTSDYDAAGRVVATHARDVYALGMTALALVLGDVAAVQALRKATPADQYLRCPKGVTDDASRALINGLLSPDQATCMAWAKAAADDGYWAEHHPGAPRNLGDLMQALLQCDAQQQQQQQQQQPAPQGAAVGGVPPLPPSLPSAVQQSPLDQYGGAREYDLPAVAIASLHEPLLEATAGQGSSAARSSVLFWDVPLAAQHGQSGAAFVSDTSRHNVASSAADHPAGVVWHGADNHAHVVLPIPQAVLPIPQAVLPIPQAVPAPQPWSPAAAGVSRDMLQAVAALCGSSLTSTSQSAQPLSFSSAAAPSSSDIPYDSATGLPQPGQPLSFAAAAMSSGIATSYCLTMASEPYAVEGAVHTADWLAPLVSVPSQGVSEPAQADGRGASSASAVPSSQDTPDLWLALPVPQAVQQAGPQAGQSVAPDDVVALLQLLAGQDKGKAAMVLGAAQQMAEEPWLAAVSQAPQGLDEDAMTLLLQLLA